MKNVSLVINGILAVAVIILFVLFFSSRPNGNNTLTNNLGSSDSTIALPIAYINVDTILANYGYAKDVTEQMIKKVENNKVTINSRVKKLENEAAEFQRKYENNAFLSQERAQQEMARIQKMEQDLQQAAGRMEQEMMIEQQTENMKIADSVKLVVATFNKAANYQIIFNKRELENIIVANEKYDVTQQVLTLLNSRYKPESGKK